MLSDGGSLQKEFSEMLHLEANHEGSWKGPSPGENRLACVGWRKGSSGVSTGGWQYHSTRTHIQEKMNQRRMWAQ